ncbi:PucR family transcriptional regulator [Carboxydothermus pertinax]|uniref:PucR C-terminal helix-turn-helix domain-containing protein n=1 Tax=Carboxydothermus pertinax TaxID=870242 RepID=A0A1L8CVQ5_9THEO|nr:helix-turn-helix domain-containing protein [Carboxydothermus pertinax]GAV22929.1 hypothetical protein cpu_14390 [Carboxydothermus pertinax]
MTFHEVVEMLAKKFTIETHLSETSPEVKDFKLVSETETSWDENTIYIGNLNKINSLPPNPIMLICSTEKISLPKGSNYIIVREHELAEIFNEVKNIIFDDLTEANKLIELATMALKGKSLPSLINFAASHLGNALVLIDASQRVLAYSTNFEIVDPLWKQNVSRGYCSYEFIQKVRASKDMTEWSKYGSDTQIITLAGDKQPKLVTRITQEEHVVGALIMIEHHTPLQSYHFKQLPIVGRILFDVFFRESGGGTFNRSLYSTLLFKLLDESDLQDTYEQINTLDIHFPAKMHIVVARFVQNINNRYLKYTFSLELERIFPKGYAVIYKGYIGILVPNVDKNHLLELTKLAQKENVSIGISWPFYNIREFKQQFYQAVAAIKHAEKLGLTKQVFSYSDFHFFDFLNNYIGKMPLENYCHPALTILKEYDNKNHTELYLTLKTYFECNKNLKLTSEKLFIHKNTLVYRLKRIQDLIQLDLDELPVVLSLLLSFQIDTYVQNRLY